MYSLPELDYPINALEPHIDKETISIHYGKHHQAYTDNLNKILLNFPEFQNKEIEVLLSNVSQIPEEIRVKVVNHGGGYLNHNLYWKYMSPKKSLPGGELLKTLEKAFGNIDVFKEKFTSVALSQFGSGWGWLVVDSGKMDIISTSNQNYPLSEGKTPILGIDVWEHAYYLKYQNKRADYINAWWNIVNWDYVSVSFTKAMG